MPNTQEGNEEKSKLTKEEAIELVETFRYLMDAYGSFAESVGKVQKDHKDAYEVMLSPASMMELPKTLTEMAQEAPELNKLFTGIFIKLSSYLPQLSNMVNLSADDKIKLGKNLKSLANDFDKLHNWIEKVEEK
mgnify:CR=1 FL=1